MAAPALATSISSVAQPGAAKGAAPAAGGGKAPAPASCPLPVHHLMPPWMPMMMPPWMTMFGMMAGKPGLAPMPVPQQSKAATAKPGTSAVRLPATASCKSTAIQQAAGVSALPAAKNDNAADAAAGDADGSKVVPEDEEVVVEPEELEVFEKVAAMERSNQQQKEQQQCSAQFERASSPSGSCHTTMQGGSSSPRSPVSGGMQPAMLPPFPMGMGCFPFPPPGFPCMPMAPMACCLPGPMAPPQLWQQQWQQHHQQQWQQHHQQQLHLQSQQQQQRQQQLDAESAPVPWSSFAADDGGDDLDKDLQQLITLPGDCVPATTGSKQQSRAAATQQRSNAPAAAITAAPGPAAAAKARSSTLKRIGSTASTYTSAHDTSTSSGAHMLQQTPGSKAKRVLRIRSIKGVGESSSASKPALKHSPAAKRSSSNNLQQHAPAHVPGVSKGGVQKKKVTINTSRGVSSSGIGSSNISKKVSTAGSAAASKPALLAGSAKYVLQLRQQSAAQVEEPSLSLLGDLDSSLSGGDALTAGVTPADNYWDTFMQEASDDGWDSLLPASDVDFVAASL